MTQHRQDPDHNEQQTWIAQVEAKQRNLTWPDALRNSRGVDALFFKGNPDAPVVQRIGCWIFGCAMFFVAATGIAEFIERRFRLLLIMSIVFALFGGWVLSRGFVGLRKNHSGR